MLVTWEAAIYLGLPKNIGDILFLCKIDLPRVSK